MPRRYRTGRRGRLPRRQARPMIRRNNAMRYRMYSNPNIRSGVYSYKRITTSYANIAVDAVGITKGTSDMLHYNLPNTGAGTNFYGAFSRYFNINELPSNTDFTALYDAWRIRKVVVKIFPLFQSQQPNTGATIGSLNCWLHTVIDHDDSAVPTATLGGLQALQNYPSYKSRLFPTANGKPVTVVIKPRSQNNGFEVRRQNWVDMNTPTEPFYGIKGIIEGVTPDATSYSLTFKIECAVYFQCKSVR